MAEGNDKEIGHSDNSPNGWDPFADDIEGTAACAWPMSIQTYDRMRTDPQVAAVLLAGMLPIRRRRWYIEPEGARPEIAEFVADELSLSVAGQEPKPKPRRRARFSHDFHLRHSLLSLVFGHMFFEQVYEYNGNDDKLLHLRKLAPRMHRTITEIGVADDGGLEYIRQTPRARRNMDGSGLIPRGTLLGDLTGAPKIPVDALVAYVHDREGSNWTGRSALRPAYGSWLLKDKLVRVDALKHQRNGLGVPVVEAPLDATDEQIKKAAAFAQKFKAGDTSGGGLPPGYKLRLVGTEGSIPDTLASIRYHDEQIAKTMLEMFLQLGTTETGSRALGETLLEFFTLSQDAIAGWYSDVTNEHVIEDLIDLNWGPDEPAPKLACKVESNERMAIADLVNLVQSGILTVDDEDRESIIEAYDAPLVSGGSSKPTKATPKPEDTADPEEAEDELEEDEKNVAASARIQAKAVIGGQEMRRNFYEHEVKAATDFEAILLTQESTTDALIAEWGVVQDQQIAELQQQIEDADGDEAKLAAITATALGADLISARLVDVAGTAARATETEVRSQGVEVEAPEVDEKALNKTAAAMAALLARSIAVTASSKALERTGIGTPAALVAQEVAEHLRGLSDTYLRDQLGGVVTQAQNQGRVSVFKLVSGGTYYASEILDRRACGKVSPPSGCKGVDGVEYPTLGSALLDYPSGRYRDCKGGVRCRGTIVGVFDG